MICIAIRLPAAVSLRLLGKPALSDPFLLLVQFADAPKTAGGRHRQNAADKIGFHLKRVGQRHAPGYGKQRPDAFGIMIFGPDHDGVKQADYGQGDYGDSDSGVIKRIFEL